MLPEHPVCWTTRINNYKQTDDAGTLVRNPAMLLTGSSHFRSMNYPIINDTGWTVDGQNCIESKILNMPATITFHLACLSRFRFMQPSVPVAVLPSLSQPVLYSPTEVCARRSFTNALYKHVQKDVGKKIPSKISFYIIPMFRRFVQFDEKNWSGWNE